MKTKNIVKRMAVTLILICLLATSAAALDQSGPVVVEPRYVGVSYNVVGLSIDPDGWSTSYGHVKTYDGYDVDIEVTLQRRRPTGSAWSEVKSWTASGTDQVELEKDWYVVSGYVYQVILDIEVYDSDGDHVDSITEFSKKVEY